MPNHSPRPNTELDTCVHGASAELPPLGEGNTKYQVTFSYNLYTWDSYNAAVGGGTGYYDSFSVSASHVPYQDIGLGDPVGVANLPGLGFIWGGTSFADGTLECYPTTLGCGVGLTLDAVAPAQTTVYLTASQGVNWLNVVLDTKSLPHANHSYPSYGRIRILSIVPVQQ